MTSLPRLYFDHKTIATQILQVLLQKIMRPLENFAHVAPQRNAVGPINLHNDQSTVIVAWIYRGTTLASLGGLAGGHFLFRKALNPPLQFQPPFSELCHWKVLHASTAITVREWSLMGLFREPLQNAWDWAVPPSSLCYTNLEVPSLELCWGNCWLNIRGFWPTCLRHAYAKYTCALMSASCRNNLSRCCMLPHISVSPPVGDSLWVSTLRS